MHTFTRPEQFLNPGPADQQLNAFTIGHSMLMVIFDAIVNTPNAAFNAYDAVVNSLNTTVNTL